MNKQLQQYPSLALFNYTLVAVPHMPVCATEAFAFSGPLLGRFPWLRHIRIGIEQILRPLIPFQGTSVSALAAVYVIGIPIFLLARM